MHGSAWDLGTFLESAAWGTTELEDAVEENKDMNPLLRQVYGKAEKLEIEDMIYKDALLVEDYRSWIGNIEYWSKHCRHRTESNIDMQEGLLEFTEVLDRLDGTLRRAMWPVVLRTEVKRFHSLGHIGNDLISVCETISTEYARHKAQVGKRRA